VNIDDYMSSGASISFDNIHSLRGAAGFRIGGDFPTGHGATISPYVGIQAIDEFSGNVRNTFTLGQTIGLEQDAPGTFGEASGGLTLRSGMLEAFARGEVDFGAHRDGVTGRAGVRFRF
jgi:outer membrane autotransporter protein